MDTYKQLKNQNWTDDLTRKQDHYLVPVARNSAVITRSLARLSAVIADFEGSFLELKWIKDFFWGRKHDFSWIIVKYTNDQFWPKMRYFSTRLLLYRVRTNKDGFNSCPSRFPFLKTIRNYQEVKSYNLTARITHELGIGILTVLLSNKIIWEVHGLLKNQS